MAIYGLESGWSLYHTKNFQEGTDNAYLSGTNSCHKGPIPLYNNRFRDVMSYWNSAPVKDIWNTNKKYDSSLMTNIHQGRVAHGVSAVMGYHLVLGTPTYVSFNNYAALISELGRIHVNAGESITDLFLEDPADAGLKRSAAAGLIILNSKYQSAVSNAGSYGIKTTSDALRYAVGSYVGKQGAADINGYTPEQRISDAYGSRNDISMRLAGVGLTRSGYEGPAVEVNLTYAKAPNRVGNSQTRVASTTSTGRGVPPGCATA
jgi:hypothetical protein